MSDVSGQTVPRFEKLPIDIFSKLSDNLLLLLINLSKNILSEGSESVEVIFFSVTSIYRRSLIPFSLNVK